MTKPLMNLAEHKFGRLQPIELDHIRANPSGNRIRYWRCICDCGTEVVVPHGSLRNGETKSCGCLRRELVAQKNAKHGRSGLPEYQVWQDMKRRCLNPKSKSFSIYGGRGISVCERWQTSFEHFHADMGARPFATATIERVDNNGNYEPGNCRWATRREQMNNVRKNVILTVDGESATLAEWARRTGMNHASILGRLAKGWDTKRALTTPPREWPSRPRRPKE